MKTQTTAICALALLVMSFTSSSVSGDSITVTITAMNNITDPGVSNGTLVLATDTDTFHQLSRPSVSSTTLVSKTRSKA